MLNNVKEKTIVFIKIYLIMVIITKQCATQKVSMQETKMEMDFVKCIQIPWRDFSHCLNHS